MHVIRGGVNPGFDPGLGGRVGEDVFCEVDFRVRTAAAEQLTASVRGGAGCVGGAGAVGPSRFWCKRRRERD